MVESWIARCGGAASQVAALGCFLAAAARSRADVEHAYQRDLRAAIRLDRAFDAFARRRRMPAASLAAQLRASQAAWLTYARSQCGFEGGSSFGGSGTDLLEAACRDRLNRQRLAELEKAAGLLKR